MTAFMLALSSASADKSTNCICALHAGAPHTQSERQPHPLVQACRYRWQQPVKMFAFPAIQPFPGIPHLAASYQKVSVCPPVSLQSRDIGLYCLEEWQLMGFAS